MQNRARRSAANDDPSPGSERWLQWAFVLALALLLFLGGALLTALDRFPGPQVQRAVTAGKALYSKVFLQDVFASDLWYPERSESTGVTRYLVDEAQKGATLYTSGSEPGAFLIDMNGQLLHSWRRPFSEIWDDSAAVRHPQPDDHVFMRKAQVDSQGNLLALYEGVGDTPYGYGLVKLDRDSKVIWRYLQHTHHDFDVAADGRIYVLTHDIVDRELEGLEHLASPRFEDYLVVLSPEGEELQKLPLLDMVHNSIYRRLLYGVSSFATADPLHTNSIHLITPDEARHFPYAKPGQLLVSFRELDAVGVIDLEQQSLTWAATGPWAGQHDPHILPNGNILLFDNLGNFAGPAGESRALEFDPSNMRLVWQYAGSQQDPLSSRIRSYTQRLANGNTLITESSGGRIVEVTAAGQIVWEYINPVRGGEAGDLVPVICKAQRLSLDSLAFLGGHEDAPPPRH